MNFLDFTEIKYTDWSTIATNAFFTYLFDRFPKSD